MQDELLNSKIPIMFILAYVNVDCALVMALVNKSVNRILDQNKYDVSLKFKNRSSYNDYLEFIAAEQNKLGEIMTNK